MDVVYALILSAMVHYGPGNKSSIYVTLAVFKDEKVCERNVPLVEKAAPVAWAPIAFCRKIPVIHDKATSLL